MKKFCTATLISVSYINVEFVSRYHIGLLCILQLFKRLCVCLHPSFINLSLK